MLFHVLGLSCFLWCYFIWIHVDVHTSFLICVYFIVNLFDSKKKYTYDTKSCKQAHRKGRYVGETKTITNGVKMVFFRSFVTYHERPTAWLFHIGVRQNYCVSHLSSNRRNGGLTNNSSVLFDRQTFHEDSSKGAHTSCCRSAPQYYTY